MRRVLFLLVAGAMLAAAQPAARFPAATATWRDLLQAKDNSRSRLTAMADSTTLSLSVEDGSKFAAWQVVLIESEKLLVCSVSGNTLTICAGGRGYGNTIPAAHTSDMAVLGMNMQEHHNVLAAEIAAIEAALGPNLSNVSPVIDWSSLTGKPTTFLYSDQSYTDPSWLTITKSKVGLGNVENTALSTWAGSGNINTIGTLSVGTVPWARLSNIPASFSPSAHTHPIGDLSTVGDYSSKITSGTYSINISGTAGGVTWTNVSSKPSTFAPAAHTHPIADLSTIGDYSSKITSGTYGISVTGSAGSVAWANVSGKPSFGSVSMLDSTQAISGAWALEWKNFANHQIVDMSAGTAPNGTAHNSTNAEVAWTVSYPTLMGWNGNSTYGVRVDSARNADTAGGLAVSAGRNSAANQVMRTDGSGYATFGWMNTDAPVENNVATSVFINSGDGYVRQNSVDVFSKRMFNVRTLDASWAWQDDYLALPTGTVQWGVFTPTAATATIAAVRCWSDTGDAVINLRRSDGGDMINGNLTCNGTETTNLNGYNWIQAGTYYVGMWEVSGTAKSIRVGIKYTVAY